MFHAFLIYAIVEFNNVKARIRGEFVCFMAPGE